MYSYRHREGGFTSVYGVEDPGAVKYQHIARVRVLGYFACSPTGPFVRPVELYRTPETR